MRISFEKRLNRCGRNSRRVSTTLNKIEILQLRALQSQDRRMASRASLGPMVQGVPSMEHLYLYEISFPLQLFLRGHHNLGLFREYRLCLLLWQHLNSIIRDTRKTGLHRHHDLLVRRHPTVLTVPIHFGRHHQSHSHQDQLKPRAAVSYSSSETTMIQSTPLPATNTS